MQNTQQNTSIILVNYNGWSDTIACIESILKQTSQGVRIIIVDNHSVNDSIYQLKKWLLRASGADSTSKQINKNHLPKNKTFKYSIIRDLNNTSYQNEDIVLISSKENKGFSGGNNIGIRFALQHHAPAYIWLLNNDTTLATNALENLIAFANTHCLSQKIAIIGATIRYYHEPEILQCAGGAKVNWRWLTDEQIGNGEKDNGQYRNSQPDIIVGASMFFPAYFFEKHGLLSESYFLYFEEQELAIKCKKLGYKPGYCPDAIVYHKEGASIQSNSTKKTTFSDYHYFRSKAIFIKQHYNYPKLTILIQFIPSMLIRLARLQPKNMWVVLQIMLKALTNTLL